MSIPRPEYPRPQFSRDRWLSLNGDWQFEIDPGDSGLDRGLPDRELSGRITVPFCPESELSGIGCTDFMPAVWYWREVTIPAGWRGMDVALRFQAVDYDATVWVNGVEVARHRGGFTPFACDLTGIASPGETAVIVVRARDDSGPPQPRGKQSQRYANHGCHYTRTTGIWQTVWMEPVPPVHILRPGITPNVAGRAFDISLPIRGSLPGGWLTARLIAEGTVISTAACAADADFTPTLHLYIPEDRVRLWSPGDPYLYDIQLELSDPSGAVIDSARSYAGLRSVTIDGKAIKINGIPVFQRLVLDQGYYPDGIMTAPTDEALRRDIELSIEAGFNGARLHQKVFEERFLYHADRLGYLVWGEFADWGCAGYGPAHDTQQPGATYITQWLEVLERDYSHPCVVGWCPLNETGQLISDRVTVLDDVTLGMFLAAKAMDGTRPVLDTSGYSHRVAASDVYDSHDYDQNPESFRKRHEGILAGRPFVNSLREGPISIGYRGQPYFVSEFGGIWWNPDASEEEDSWGYGDRPKSVEEFYARFKGLCDALLDNPAIFGYCYTQLTDVYQEQNGVYRFDRSAKFDAARLKAVQQRAAAIEMAAGNRGGGQAPAHEVG